MNLEKLSYLIASILGVGSLLGCVWMVAVSTTSLSNQIKLLSGNMAKVSSAYTKVLKATSTLSLGVQRIEADYLHVVYIGEDHIIVGTKNGILLDIPMERTNADVPNSPIPLPK